MRFVYLDQNHVSRIAAVRLGRIEDPVVEAVERRLLELVAAEEVLCPYSAFHVYETLRDDNDARRDAVCTALGALSRGVCLRHLVDRVEDELQGYLDRALLRRQADDLTTHPFGFATDCFPRESIEPETYAYVTALPREDIFGFVVDLAREAGDIREQAEAFSRALHAHERDERETRDGERPNLPQLRAIELDGLLNAPELSDLIRAVGERNEVRHPLFRDMVVGEQLRTQRGLAALLEIRARRVVSFGMRPDPGDPMDVGHLGALPYVQLFATDRRAAGIARDAGRMFGCTVIARPSDLLEELQRMFPR